MSKSNFPSTLGGKKMIFEFNFESLIGSEIMYARRRTTRTFPARRRVPRVRRRVGRRPRFSRPQPASAIYYPMLPSRSNVGSSGLADTMAIVMKTFDNIAVAPGATHVEYAFKVNSTFDPMGDMSAVQPGGRDQMATLYNSYIVLSGAYRITFTNTTAAPVFVCCYTSGQSAVAASINNYGTQPGAVYKTAAKSGDGDTRVVLKRSFRCTQLFGPLDRSSHGAAVGADPTTLGYVYLTIYSTSGNVTGHLMIEATQNTQFFDKVANVHA